jgi:hypothetical protein
VADDKEKEISKLERIKRIIGILRLDGREVEINLPHSIETGRVAETASDTFRIRLSDPTVDVNRQEFEFLHLSFIFSGEELIGRCPVSERAHPYLTIGYPKSFKTRTKRRYPRIRPPIPIKAKLKYKRFPQRMPGRVSPKDLPVKYSKLYWEAQRESVDIKKLFVLVGGELKKICPHSGIVVYNDQSVNTREAEMMRKSGKVLFIADCERVESYTRLIPSEKITNYSFLLDEKKEAGATREEIGRELKEIMQDDRRQGCSSKVLVPIFSKDEVIGHLNAHTDKKGTNISYEQVADLMALGLILRIGIEHAPLVPSFDDSIDTDLLNISEGGLFLQISSGTGTISIPEGADAQIRFLAGDKEIVLTGTVCRRSAGEQSYAIKFTKIADDQKSSLKSFIDESIEKLSENK